MRAGDCGELLEGLARPQFPTHIRAGEIVMTMAHLLISRAGSEVRRNTCAQFTRWRLKTKDFRGR